MQLSSKHKNDNEGEEDDSDDEDDDAEVLCMAFLEPYPVLVCGDSSGMISFFSVRPATFKNQLLLRVDVGAVDSTATLALTKVFAFLLLLFIFPLIRNYVSAKASIFPSYRFLAVLVEPHPKWAGFFLLLSHPTLNPYSLVY